MIYTASSGIEKMIILLVSCSYDEYIDLKWVNNDISNVKGTCTIHIYLYVGKTYINKIT